MVGYITVAHGGAQRLSEKWRHFVVHCLYSLFCTSPRCVGVARTPKRPFRFLVRTARTSKRPFQSLVRTARTPQGPSAISVAGAAREFGGSKNRGEIGGYQDELPGKTGGSSEPPRLFLGALLPGARKSPRRLFPHTEQHPQPAAMRAGEGPSRTKRRPKRRRETRTTTGDRRKREAPQRASSCLSAAARTTHTSAARRRRALQTDSQTGGDSMRESERWCVQHERAETTNALT